MFAAAVGEDGGIWGPSKRWLPVALLVLAFGLAGCGASLGPASEPKLGVGMESGSGPKADASAVGGSLASPFVASSMPGNTAYKIGPSDVLELSVFKVPELSKVSHVSMDGTVNLPLVGDIPAAGKTTQELERHLTRELGAKYLQKPQVTIIVREYNSQRVTVEGAVKKQGVFPLRGSMSLLQTIASAEGLDANADSTVVIFRQTEKGRAAARFDLSEIRAGTAEDPVVQAGDVIVVSSSVMKETLNSVLKILPLVSIFALL